MKKTAIYIHYAEGKSCPSIETQKNACFKYAEEHGYTITAIYTNSFDGALRLGSVAYQKVAECVAKNNFDSILIYSIQSVFPCEQDFLAQSIMLKKKGIDLLSVAEPDYKDSGVQMVAFILQSYDEYLRAEHSQKVKRGMQLAKERKEKQRAEMPSEITEGIEKGV